MSGVTGGPTTEDQMEPGKDGEAREATWDVPGEGRTLDYFGLSLVLLRLLRGMSQAELADRAGIRSNQVSRYETGQVWPQLNQVQRLVDALEIDVSAFFSFMGRVRFLGLSVATAEGAGGRLAAEIHGIFHQVDGLQLILGERLMRVLAEGLDKERLTGLAREILEESPPSPC